jgi:alanine or glycine:cation symporter, AGCS family
VLGGPMRYLHVGLRELGLGPFGKALSILFMVLCIGASFGGGNAYQVGQSLSAIQQDVKFLNPDHGGYPVVYGIVMAVLVGLVIIGGIKSIGAVAARIVPIMCIGYMLACMFILVTNVTALPQVVMEIVSQAFDVNSIYGGIVGVMVIGVQRAVFSNEAGVGSAAIAHSAAKTDEPVSEGIVALLEPFIDTVVVCTATALVIIVTGVYDADKFVSQHDPSIVVASLTLPDGAGGNDVDAAKGQLAKLISDKDGAAMTLAAFRSGGKHWFGYILLIAVVLFAYSTCISWSYYGERSWVELFGESTSIVYKLLFLAFTVLGSIVTRGNILDFSDLMILSMSIPNLIGVFLLSGVVKRRLDLYWDKYKSGELDRKAMK